MAITIKIKNKNGLPVISTSILESACECDMLHTSKYLCYLCGNSNEGISLQGLTSTYRVGKYLNFLTVFFSNYIGGV